MMTKSKFNQKLKLIILALTPLAVILFLEVEFVNGQAIEDDNIVVAVAPTKMNVLYLGVDNPVKIAVSGYKSSELDVYIEENGMLLGSNGDFIVRPRRPGSLFIVIKHGDKVIHKAEFRVKIVPDPVVKIAGKMGGTIDKETLMEQEELTVEMNCDFDLSFEIVEFRVAAAFDGYLWDAFSNSNKITNDQKEILNKLVTGQNVYFQDIKSKGPDGSIRKMNNIVLEIM